MNMRVAESNMKWKEKEQDVIPSGQSLYQGGKAREGVVMNDSTMQMQMQNSTIEMTTQKDNRVTDSGPKIPQNIHATQHSPSLRLPPPPPPPPLLLPPLGQCSPLNPSVRPPLRSSVEYGSLRPKNKKNKKPVKINISNKYKWNSEKGKSIMTNEYVYSLWKISCSSSNQIMYK